jgi:hypothetical protein
VPAVRLSPDHAGGLLAAAVRREETWKTAEILSYAISSPSCSGGNHAART